MQTLAKEVVLALGDSAGEEGFAMDQEPGQVGIELARVHWLWGHSLGVICSGRSPGPEGLPAPAETAYFSSSLYLSTSCHSA